MALSLVAPSGVPPTAQTSFGAVAQTPKSVALVPDALSANVAPSQCVIRPFSPTSHTSVALVPWTHQYESVLPGWARRHT